MFLQPSPVIFHQTLSVIKSIYCCYSGTWLICYIFLILCHSGPMRAYILAREDAIHHWRELMGPTKVFRARYTSPASIRGQFGLTDTRNTTHGSGRKGIMKRGNKELPMQFLMLCSLTQ